MFKNLKKIFKFGNTDRDDIELIRNSKYFDEKYYLLENPGLKGDPCKHYYYYGWKEGKSPNYNFSNNFYLKNYKDVEDAGINPLLHYLKFGKAENRVIERDNGLSLKKVYEEVYGCAYFYKTYIYDTKAKRVNLFFDSIDESVENFSALIQYVIHFCNKNHYQLRVIYFKADFELLKTTLQKHHLKLPKEVVFLNLKSSNYLEVGMNEKYICTSWKNARALLNTASVHSNVYYFLPDHIDDLSKEEYYQVSNICTNDNVIVLARNRQELQYIKKCQLQFETNGKKISLGSIHQLYCDFDRMFIVGIELLNDAFLSGVLDSNSWSVNIIEHEKDFKFHFDTNVMIRRTMKINEDASFIFHISYDKKNYSYDQPFVNGWVEETECCIEKFIVLEEDKDFKQLLNQEDFVISTIDNYYDQFKNCIAQFIDKR